MSDPKKRNPLSLLLTVVLAALIVFTGRWYYYVAYAESPFDEVGISLNSMMPGPLNSMGCGMLKARFEKTSIPPVGCGVGTKW